MDLETAIAKHTEWKMKLRSAISRQERLQAETIAKDDACEFGKWLYGEAKTKYGRLAAYGACVSKHAAFHQEAGKVARAINAKKFTEGEAMLGSGTSFAAASSAVGVAIVGLKKEAAL